MKCIRIYVACTVGAWFIKDYMTEKDRIMDEEDYKYLASYKKEKADNKLISHYNLKAELAILEFSTKLTTTPTR